MMIFLQGKYHQAEPEALPLLATRNSLAVSLSEQKQPQQQK
jgi:hypothetical protein